MKNFIKPSALKSRIQTLFLSLGAFGLMGAAFAAEPAIKAPAAPAVTVLKLQPTELVENLLVTGSLIPREEILIHPEIEGLKITEILVEEGDHVEAGQVLARLSRDGLNAQMEQWAATLEMSKARLRKLKRRWARALRLYSAPRSF